MKKLECLGAILGSAGVLLGASILVARSGAAEVLLPQRFASHGALRADGGTQLAATMEAECPWSVEVHRSGPRSYEGLIRVAGVPGLKEAVLHSEAAWPMVSGVATDDSGRQLAVFEGTISLTDGIGGRFTTVDGSGGSWFLDWP